MLYRYVGDAFISISELRCELGGQQLPGIDINGALLYLSVDLYCRIIRPSQCDAHVYTDPYSMLSASAPRTDLRGASEGHWSAVSRPDFS